MIGSFQTGVSGLQVFQEDLEVIGNNIANVNTVGYKSSHMEFEDALSQNLVTGATPMQVGTGVSTAAINTSFTGGPINPTGNSLDLAISGAGFLLLRDTSTSASYVTRDGELSLDANGYVTTNSGMRVEGYTGAGPYTSASPIGDIQINDAAAIAALNPAAAAGHYPGHLEHRFARAGQWPIKRRDHRRHRAICVAKFH